MKAKKKTLQPTSDSKVSGEAAGAHKLANLLSEPLLSEAHSFAKRLGWNEEYVAVYDGKDKEGEIAGVEAGLEHLRRHFPQFNLGSAGRLKAEIAKDG